MGVRSFNLCEFKVIVARILVIVALLVTVQALGKNSTLPEKSTVNPNPHINRGQCGSKFERLRNIVIDQSKCGTPKEVLEVLKVRGSHLELSPHAVVVKKCVGICDYDSFGTICVPLEKKIRHIPVRIYNVRTNKDDCSKYAIEEHVSCGCCDTGDPEQCAAPQVLDPPTTTQTTKTTPRPQTSTRRPWPASAGDYQRTGSQRVDCRKGI